LKNLWKTRGPRRQIASYRLLLDVPSLIDLCFVESAESIALLLQLRPRRRVCDVVRCNDLGQLLRGVVVACIDGTPASSGALRPDPMSPEKELLLRIRARIVYTRPLRDFVWDETLFSLSLSEREGADPRTAPS